MGFDIGKIESAVENAGKMWNNGLVTQKNSDEFDRIISDFLDKDVDKSGYKKWMVRVGASYGNPRKINEFYDFCFSKIDIPKDAIILDVGARMGIGLNLLQERGYNNISGIDLYDETPQKYRIDTGDIHNTHYECDTFDLIIFKDVIEHCYDQCGSLKEVYRILKPGGYVFFRFPVAIALWWNNCRRITVEIFSKWIHDIGFISEHMNVHEEIGNNVLYNGMVLGILKK